MGFSGPCNVQNVREGYRIHIKVSDNNEGQPFLMKTRLHEVHLDELNEDRNNGAQKEDGGCENIKVLTIREELGNLFRRKEAQLNQQVNEDVTRQTERVRGVISHVAGQLWSYREKPKMKRIVNAAGRAMIQRMHNGEEYYVELAEDQQDMDEDIATVAKQRTVNQGALQLALDIGMNLNLKRKKDTSSFTDFNDMMKEEDLSMVKSGKKFKNDAGTVMAEEAGLNMPHQQP
ncbi:uncharacterized protein DS421_3g98050 [Arachis hypogaea]|nr:uncharacterized protein DS421_3g98050 [Arachis hypogaea]